MVGRLVSYLWGELSSKEIKKFSLLSLIFFFLIGSYWLLRTQKNAAFNAIVGFEHQPKAKILSLFVSVALVLMYSKLVDLFSKNTLLIGFALLYASGFLVTAYLLEHTTIGFLDPVASPHRIFGWLIYLFIESYAALLVGFFWAFVSSTTDAATAEKGYPLIIAGSQMGSVLGSWLSFKSAYFGNAFLFNVGAVGISIIVPIAYFYLWVTKEAKTTKRKGAGFQPEKTGAIEGLKILLTRPYVLGILMLCAFYDIIVTIIEFQMNMVARTVFPTKEAFASFNGMYGVLTNCLSLAFALFGTSFLIRRYGLRFCLLVSPVVTAFMVVAIYVSPALYMLTAAIILIKGLSYALNNPAKEMMYIPTTKDVRFKAKGWIDQFGCRSAKGIGATINNMLPGAMGGILVYGTLISLGLVGVWAAVAAYVGGRFKSLTDRDEVVS